MTVFRPIYKYLLFAIINSMKNIMWNQVNNFNNRLNKSGMVLIGIHWRE